jgi:hypothetical protein
VQSSTLVSGPRFASNANEHAFGGDRRKIIRTQMNCVQPLAGYLSVPRNDANRAAAPP